MKLVVLNSVKNILKLSVDGRCSVKEDVFEIKTSVTLLIDHVIKMFFKEFFKVPVRGFFYYSYKPSGS